MADRKLIRMIQKKTSPHLKSSMMLFLLSLIFIVIFFVYIQYQKMKYNFTDNPNTHIVEIDYKKENNSNEICKLSFKDMDVIEGLLAEYEKFIPYFEYNINFGMSDRDGDIFFVKSISSHAMDILGIENLGDDTAYCCSGNKQNEITLQIPYIDIVEGGFSSSRSTEQHLKLISLDTITQPFSEMKHFKDIIYVSENTFKKIIEKMYDTQWETFVDDYESGKSTGIQVVDKIYLYIEDIKDVNQIALTLEKEGYVNKYVLNASDNY